MKVGPKATTRWQFTCKSWVDSKALVNITKQIVREPKLLRIREEPRPPVQSALGF
jgi:hypothetical protein